MKSSIKFFISRRTRLVLAFSVCGFLLLLGSQNFTGAVNDQDTVHLEYSYDLGENVIGIIDHVNPGYNQSFSFDGASRLTSATFPNSASLVPLPANSGGSITYNKTGDILSYTEYGKATRTMAYDSSRQLILSSTGANPSSYSHDANGRMIASTANTYVYKSNNNLYQLVNATSTSNFSYDGADIRVKKAVTKAGLVRTTYYVYAGNNLMFEGSVGANENNESNEYIYLGNNLVASRKVTTPAGCTSNCTPTISMNYYHYNPVRSIVAVSDATGFMTRERYNAYGSPLDMNNTTNTNFNAAAKIRYAGHLTDDESSLVYMGKRFYDPKIGRFLIPDPVDFKVSNLQSFNKYAYANNNPNKFIDPDGREPLPADVNANLIASYEQGRKELWIEEYRECFSIFKNHAISGRNIPASRLQTGGITQRSSLASSGFVFVGGGDVNEMVDFARFMNPGSEGALILTSSDSNIGHIVNLYMDNDQVLHLRDFGMSAGAEHQLHNSYNWDHASLLVNASPMKPSPGNITGGGRFQRESDLSKTKGELSENLKRNINVDSGKR